MFKEVDIPKAMEEAKKTREYISSLTPLQTWHDIRDRVYMIQHLTKVNEDQSKALDEIAQMASNQLDNIRFPKKK